MISDQSFNLAWIPNLKFKYRMGSHRSMCGKEIVSGFGNEILVCFLSGLLPLFHMRGHPKYNFKNGKCILMEKIIFYAYVYISVSVFVFVIDSVFVFIGFLKYF